MVLRFVAQPYSRAVDRVCGVAAAGEAVFRARWRGQHSSAAIRQRGSTAVQQYSCIEHNGEAVQMCIGRSGQALCTVQYSRAAHVQH